MDSDEGRSGYSLHFGLAPATLSAAPHPALNTDRWFYGLFQSAPDLIRWLAVSPDGVMPSGAVPTELDRQYRFSAPELIAGSHRLDGVLWPIDSEAGSEELPVVLLEVQMRADPAFTTAWRPRPSASCSSITASSTGAGALDQPGGARPTKKP